MWVVHLPSGDVDVESDVPLSVWAEIEKETGVGWIQAAGRPLSNASVACALVQKLAAWKGDEAPSMTMKTALTVIEWVEDEPESFPTSGTTPDEVAPSQPAEGMTATS